MKAIRFIGSSTKPTAQLGAAIMAVSISLGGVLPTATVAASPIARSSANSSAASLSVLAAATTTASATVTFAPGGAISLSTATNYPADCCQAGYPSNMIAQGDLNRDGKPDVVVGGTGGVSILVSNGDGSFRTAVFYPSDNSIAAAPAIADVNSDGIPDILVGNEADFRGHNNMSISVLFGRADSTFAPAVNTPLPYGVSNLAVGDINHDGKMDVVADQYVGGLLVLMGTGDGHFQGPVTYGAHAGAGVVGNVILFDMNSDASLDIVLNDYYAPGADCPTFGIFLNNGNGTFAPENFTCVTPNTYSTVFSIALADLNGDGIPDIVASDNNQSIDLFLGAGDGTFTRSWLPGSGWFLTATDMNGDNHVDILTSNITAIPGNGDGTFTGPQTSFAADRSPMSMVAADFNGDGRPDVAVANWVSNDVSVLLNTTAPPVGGGPIGGPVTSAQTYGCNCGAQRLQATHGTVTPKPINTKDGNFWHMFTDVAIPGRGLGLNWSHTYNSLAAAGNGSLGYGWASNYTMALSVDSATKNATVTAEDGSQATFTYTGGTYAPSAPRFVATLVANANGTYTYVRAARTTLTFSSIGQLTSQKDLNGNTTTFAYTGSQLTTVRDPAGRTLTLGYSGSHLTTVTDANATPTRAVRFAYNDGQGNLTDVTDVNGGITHFTYDPNHLLLTMTDSRGGVVTNHYDALNRVDWQTDPLNRKTSLAYTGDNMSTGGGTTTITDPKGNVSVETYQYGERMSVTKGAGTSQAALWQYTYDPATLGITTITDPNNQVTAMTYDASGNTLTATDALSRQTVNTYNALNEILTTQDPKNVTTTLTYDTRGNILTVSTPLVGSGQTRVTTYLYTDAAHPGDVTGVIDPDNQTWTYGYDTYGDQTSQTDPLGNKTTSTFNMIGWKLTTVSPKRNTRTYGYTDAVSGLNKFGDVITVTDPLGHVSTRHYDADRNVDKVIDPDGHVTSYTYDPANQLTVTTRADATTVRTSYNPDGTIYQQIDGRGTATTYGYDALGRATSVADPLNRVTRVTYDGAGNRLTVVDAQASSQTATFAYDVANQLSSITYSDGKTPNVSNLTYDADGQRLTMTDGTGGSSWAYDSLHRLTSSTDGAGSSVGYGYDLKGQLTSITYPGNNLKVVRGYDAAGRLNQVADWLGHTTKFGYDPDSNLITESIASTPAMADSFTYDAAERLMGITVGGSKKALASFTYARDAADQLTSEATSGMDGPTQNYGYNTLNQVSTVNKKSYTYDAADNITALTTGATLSYDPANELTKLTAGSASTQFSFDPRGNRLTLTPSTGPPVTYAYDQANRLIAYGTSATYSYNGEGLRVAKTVAGVAEPFVWNLAQGLPLLLKDGTTSYVYGPGGLPLEQISSSGAVLYYHHDQLGSTRLLTDAAGKIAATYTYDAYGNTTASAGAVANPFKYSGQFTDTESGLYYLRARYYDPATAQFLTRDLLTVLTRSPYGYVAGNPLNSSDPSGLLCNPLTDNCAWGGDWISSHLFGGATTGDTQRGDDQAQQTQVLPGISKRDLLCAVPGTQLGCLLMDSSSAMRNTGASGATVVMDAVSIGTGYIGWRGAFAPPAAEPWGSLGGGGYVPLFANNLFWSVIKKIAGYCQELGIGW